MARSHVALLLVAFFAGCGDEDAAARSAREAFEARRAEMALMRGLFDHACAHAQAVFDAFEPGTKGGSLLPPQVVADLNEAAKSSPDPMTAEAARRYPGFRYVVTFEENDLAVPGASVVVDIEIRGLSGERDPSSHKWFITRRTPGLGR